LTLFRKRAVFLDRDGVINEMWRDPEHGTVDSPSNPDQFLLLPNVGKAIQLLREIGLVPVVVSNQPGIAKGKMVPRLLDAITSKMHRELAQGGTSLEAVYYCLHHPEAVNEEYRVICNCRKPKPGLIHQATVEMNLDLPHSYLIGDGMTDILAGRAVGCSTILLGTTKCDQCRILRENNAEPDFVARDLLSAVALIQKILA
jgi:D-glycero-D-manno-heptose 1,7-bisphosphate phosphatase